MTTFKLSKFEAIGAFILGHKNLIFSTNSNISSFLQ